MTGWVLEMTRWVFEMTGWVLEMTGMLVLRWQFGDCHLSIFYNRQPTTINRQPSIDNRQPTTITRYIIYTNPPLGNYREL
jgi:hypothetical protein